MAELSSASEHFFDLFRGSQSGHYVRENGNYRDAEGPLTQAEVNEHLRGGPVSVLSVPILPEGVCHFGCLDIDRHGDGDAAVDHAELARQVTRLGLPLIVCQSKNPKSAHLWLFFKDSAGFSAEIARRLLERYRHVLGITGNIDIFPRQDNLKEGQLGNGINLPFYGAQRTAFGKHGEALDLDGFLSLAQERRSYGQLLADRDLTASSQASPDAKAERALPVAVIRELHAKNLASLRAMLPNTGRNNALNTTAFFAARAFAAHALEGTEVEVKQAIRAAALACKLSEDEIRQTATSGWNSGAGKPLLILDPKCELEKVDAWLYDLRAGVPELKDAVASLVLCDPLEVDRRRKALAERLGVSARGLSAAITRHRRDSAPSKTAPIYELRTDTVEHVRLSLANLLLTTSDERAELGLPLAQEAADHRAEELLWDYVKQEAQILCTDSGQGYVLFRNKKEQPVPVTRDGHELNDFLTGLGIHSGSRPRHRIGKHLGTMCWREGARVEPRISFHFDPDTCTAYFAEELGQLIRVSANEITRVPNGTDGQLFLFPRNYEPWQLNLDALPSPTDFCPDLEALLPDVLFDVIEFENESLSREDLHVLLNAYTATLFLPRIVAGKLLLQVLGDTGSAKTLFLRLLGRLIYGQHFEVTGLDTDEKQVENALVNNSFVVFDDVKRTSNAAILGMIRRACTGGTCNRRELYSTFGQVTEPYRAAVAISCSEEPFTSSDEMSNRALIVRAKQRETYVDEKDFLQRIDANRDRLMAEMMVRLQNVILAVKAQRNFKPAVKMRMASFATFLLRVGRHYNWGPAAQQILDAWREEQDGTGLDPSIMEALDHWMADPRWESKRYSAGELCGELEQLNLSRGINAWWHGKDAALVRALRHAFHAYQRHYGFRFIARTSGPKPPQYWFEPNQELLTHIRARVAARASGQVEISF